MSARADAATPLVLLHGWAMTPRVWEPVLPGLSPGRRVCNLPLPGYAKPVDCRGAAGRLLDAWSDQCLEAVEPGAVWVGWSLGALIALNAALRRPGSIAGLVLVAATPKFIRSNDWQAGIGDDVLAGFLGGIQSGDDKTLRRFVLLQAGESDDPRALSRALSPCLAGRDTPAGVLAAGLRVLQGVDLRARLPDVGVPVRVIHGVQDRLVPVEAGRYVAGHVPAGDLVRLDTGHAPLVTRPGAVSDAVRTWI